MEFHINLILASFFNCSNIPVDSIQSACWQLNQSLEQIFGLFFAGIAIIFTLALMGIEVSPILLFENILWSVIGIGISSFLGIDYFLDIILLILSFLTGRAAKLVSFLIIGYNAIKILAILQSIF